MCIRDRNYIYTFHKDNAALQAAAPVKETETQAIYSGKNFKAVFDKKSGMLVSYKYNGMEYILNGQGLHPNFWRAPIDNDYGAGLPHKLGVWKEVSYGEVTAAVFNARNGEVTCSYKFPKADASWDITYKIYADGVIKVNNRFVAANEKTPMIPRIGLRMQMPETFTTLTYYGRGPEENYRDRRTSQFFGEYSLPIKDMYEPYIRPQENNHRTDIYWCAFTNKSGAGLLLVADRTFELNASNHPLETLDSGDDLHNAAPRTAETDHRHLTDPKPEKVVDVFVDYRMMGIGGDNSWGALPHEPYLIRTGSGNAIEYGFTLVPFGRKVDFRNLIYQY